MDLTWASSAGEEESAADPVLEQTLSVNINHNTLLVCRVRCPSAREVGVEKHGVRGP